MSGKAENTDRSRDEVVEFIASIGDDRQRDETHVLDAMHRRVTGCEPAMWGPSIIGYGSYHYRYDSGREGDWMRAGFSPRKGKFSIYLMGNYCDRRAEADDLFARLGQYKTGKSCLYVTRLERIDLDVLERLVDLSWHIMLEKYPE